LIHNVGLEVSGMPLTTSSADFELMFESAPISLWLEDYSQLKTLFDGWRAQGIADFKAHVKQHPEVLGQCAGLLKILKVNQKTLEVFGAASQEELVSRLSDVFRDDMFGNIAVELEALWSGNLKFSNQSVNYALDGRRMDVQIHIRVLQGHEGTWDRVLVSLEDISARVAAQNALVTSEQHARNLFDYSPVSLWVEDFSGVKILLDEARALGIEDFRVFISVHPEFVERCMEAIKVLDVNRQTLTMFGAANKEELVDNLGRVFRDEMAVSFADQLQDLWNGKTVQMREVVNYALSGEVINIHLQFAVMAGYESSWDRVLVSLVDITARKKAEAYLEYLGKHDSLTRLRNRAYYAEELNRVSRKGPWPLSVLAMDLNGLKRVNDSEGHAAGDALLRRVGEVLTNATAGAPYCVARIGGDEFVILMPGCDERLAHNLKGRIDSTLELNNQFYPGQHLSLAIGIASCVAAGQVEAAVHQADHTMFEAKALYYAQNNLERRHPQKSELPLELPLS
jgi:diguanylate cyclase (GGDEF)-like protein